MIETSVIKQIYVGDGETTHFPFPFPFESVDDVKVSLYDIPSGIETQLTSDYFVDVNASEVIYPGYPPGEEPPESEQPPVLPETKKIIIYRSTPISQLQDLGEKFPLPIIETMVDKVTMIDQEISEKLGRAVTVQMGSDHSPDEFMQDIADAVQTAKDYADEAKDSADDADDSVTKAATWAEGTDADVSDLGGTHSAKGWADVSKGHSDDASGYATAASGSAASASAAETNASYWAEGTDGQVAPLGGTHSAKGWAADSAASAASVVANVDKAQKWAEGSDPDVTPLGGEHSSKGWSDQAKAWAMSMANLPVAIIVPWGGSSNTPPVGFLFCDGSAVSRTMYPDLFAAIGTTYGPGDGSTTFNLPDLRFIEGTNNTAPVFSNGKGMVLKSGLSADATSGAFWNVFHNGTGLATTQGAYGNTYNFPVSSDNINSNVYADLSNAPKYSSDIHYMIKAFDGQTADSALIDVTQYAADLANKASRGLDNLTQTGEDHFLESDFTIIYPNGGSEGSPANVTVNSRYVEANPFPGYIVSCIAEVLENGEWGNPEWYDMYTSGISSSGVRCNQLDDDSIVVQTGNAYIHQSSAASGNPFGVTTYPSTAPCRVKVWKIGKI